MDVSGPDAEAAGAIALVIVAVLLPLVASLWLRDAWRKLRGTGPTNAEG